MKPITLPTFKSLTAKNHLAISGSAPIQPLKSLSLPQFPAEITRLQLRQLDCGKGVRQLHDELNRIHAQIERVIAWDQNLSTESRRHSRRIELQLQDPCLKAQIQLRMAQDALREVEIELQLRLNQFAVAQLHARERIARIESLATA